MKNLFLFLLLVVSPFLSSCNLNDILHDMDNDHDGGYITVDSIGVANIDGSGFKMLGEGENPQITPDSKKILFSNVHYGIYSVNVDGSGLTCIYQKKSIFNLLLSPDGKRAAFTSDSLKTIYLINTDGSGFTQLYGSKYDKFILYFSNDGSKLYFNENKNFSSVDLNGNCKILSTDPAFSGFGQYPQILADESKIIHFKYTGVYPNLFLKDLKSQKDSMLADCDPVDHYMQPAKFISQNTFLYVYNHTIYSYDLISGKKQSSITISNLSNPFSDGSCYFSLDGRKVVYRTYWDKVEVADIDGTAKTALTIPESTPGYNPYQISPDNKKVIFTSVSQKYVQ